MKTNFRRLAVLALMLMMLFSVVALGQKKKKRKRVPTPRSRAEVVTMSGGSTHDVEWQRNKNGTGTLQATGDKPPNESYKSPLDSLGKGESSPAASKATTNARSKRTSAGSNLIKSVPPTTRPSLRIGKPTTFDYFEREIMGEMNENGSCCIIKDLDVAQRILGEMKRQLATGRKVTIGDGTAIGPDNITLRTHYQDRELKNTLTYLSDGRTLDFARNLSGVTLTQIDDSHYKWGYVDDPRDEYEACMNLLTKTGPTTLTARCESPRAGGDKGIETTLINVDLMGGTIHRRIEIRGTNTLEVYEGNSVFNDASIWLLRQR